MNRYALLSIAGALGFLVSPVLAGDTGSSSTTLPTGSSTTVTSSTVSSSSSSSSSSTMPSGGFTRTPGFYKNRPVITLDILVDAGGLKVCGVNITNVDVDSASSALEAMCVSIEGTTKLQLARSLMAAALTQAAGGATFGGFGLCNLVCEDPAASADEISACIKVTGAFNESGDNLAGPFGGGAANPDPCKLAKDTDCTIIDPGSCANP